MTPQPLIADRVLLFGRDAQLLETRALVLRSAGMVVDVVLNIEQFRVRIADPNSTYAIIVCCYTTTEAECKEVIDATRKERISFIQLEYFVLPETLIHQVSELVRKRHSLDG